MRNPKTKTIVISLALVIVALFAYSPVMAKSILDGELAVKNSRTKTVTIDIDGRRTVRLAPGARRILRNIPNGVRIVTIRGRHGPPLEKRISVPVQGRAKLKVIPRTGTAQIKNDSSIRMRVSINNRSIGTVAPGSQLLADILPPGIHTLRAVPVRARLARAGVISRTFRVHAGQQTRVSLGQFFGRVEITNPYNRRVALWVDGERLTGLSPRETFVVDSLKPGTHTVELRKRGRSLSVNTIRLGVGQVASWTPRAAHNGRISIANRSGSRVKVSIDDARFQFVRPGRSAVFNQLEPGRHEVSIYHRNGRVESRTVHVSWSGIARLTVERRRGSSGRPVYVAHR